MNAKAPLKIGFVGVGRMGQCAHLRNYATLPECEVVALAEIRPNLGRAVATRYNIPNVYTSAAEMLAANQLDALVAIQPFTRYGQILPELATHGLPLMIEKPLANSVATGEKILAACEANGSRVMVGYHKRSDPAIAYAKAEITRLQTSGELGALRYVRLTMPMGDWSAGAFSEFIRSDEPLPTLPDDPPASNLSAEENAALIRFINFYIHQVNLLRHLLGEPYQVTYADPAGVILVAQSASGVTGMIEMSPYTTTRGWDESVLIAFERGYLKVELPAPLAGNQPGRVEIRRGDGASAAEKETASPQVIIPQLPPLDAMRAQAKNFIRFAADNAPAPCAAAEALEDLKIAHQYIRCLLGG